MAREVAAALDRKIPTFPVFVGEAGLLTRNDLPLKLLGLEMCQAFRMTAQHWAVGLVDLAAAIRKTAELTPVPAFQPDPSPIAPAWTDFGVLSQALMSQPAMRSALAILAKGRDPGVTNLLTKYACAEHDSEARRLTRGVLNQAGVSWQSGNGDMTIK